MQALAYVLTHLTMKGYFHEHSISPKVRNLLNLTGTIYIRNPLWE